MDEGLMIEVKNLCKSYKEVDVLNGLDLNVKRGEIFTLLGVNGAGKTTMVKILSTLLKPDQGSIKVAGVDVVKEPEEVKRHIALTGQYAAVDEILSGRENLTMMAQLLRVDNYKEIIEKLLFDFDLLEAADRRVATYSGGMKRKLDIAMSLIGDPSVIFLDEPTTGLDPQSRKVMWKMIQDFASNGVTIFLTTQYLDEAEALADRVAILDKGRIIAEGRVHELKDIMTSSIIKLTFKTEEETLKAKMLLNDYNPEIDVTYKELLVETHDSMGVITQMFDRLKTTNIEIKNLEQKKASLEDVFLHVVSEDMEREMKDAISS